MKDCSREKRHDLKEKTSVEFIEEIRRNTAKKEFEGNKVVTCPSYTSAPELTVTVASFRTWRSSQLIVAREPEQVTITRRIIHKKMVIGY